jgi:RimJ/RimL family protein N-acetyltransferase
MRPAIEWSFAIFDLEEIVYCIDPENVASQAVARRLGAVNEGGAMLLRHPVDLWVTHRGAWRG